MADTRITDLAVLTGAQIADNDPFVVVDVSDHAMATSGTNKRINFSELSVGLSTSKKVVLFFTYTDSTPLDFGSLPAGASLVEAQVAIDIPFNDPATLLSLGTVSAPDTILPTNTIDPTVASTYSNGESVFVPTADSLRFKILPAASTQGAGRVVVLYTT